MVKELDDYVDDISKKYKEFRRETVKAVLAHGLSTMYELAKKGVDVQIYNGTFSAYIGRLRERREYSLGLNTRIKQTRKVRTYNSMKYNLEYTGVYFVGMSDEEFKDNTGRNGKVRKKIKLGKCRLFKLKEECYLYRDKTHFFKVYFPFDMGWTIERDKLITNECAYYSYRDENNEIVKV